MSSPLSVTVRRVLDPADPALPAFGRVQDESYYDPDTLMPPQMFPRLVSGPRNRVLVAEDESGQVLGGTVFHLMTAAGFTSFTGVARQAQGRGVGWALHAAKLEEVRAAGLAGIFADSVFAGRQDAEDREAEAKAGSSATARRAALHAWGLRTVDIPYWQPVGGPNGGPLTDLDLLYQPLDGSQTVPLDLVTQTLQAYWNGWLGQKRAAQEAQALADRAEAESLRLLPATETSSYWQERTRIETKET
ncbi:GNAT family N-acetyltransferase [Deinococcus sp. Arct2-2]|uniref:GNAT family N-acetyltransferase n=1 Tax=Deinococcus sp. Arct2-2 TaxID=2568653 RepID=UPI0010A33090|nr:GNAT family N-acetyltransferase [Deinococcus sp. Arct2-2]THF69344.1 GNAT family N-acetyltransferase [Deinococcus sp. Arct2-2]